MKLTYKFNNDEKNLEINKEEYLAPENIIVYIREGDTVYVKNGDYVYINQLIKEASNGIKSYATVSGTVEMNEEEGIIKVVNDKTNSAFVSEEALDDISEVKKEVILEMCENLGIDYENKLIVNKLKNKSKVLIINAIDVEPYQFNNNYLFQDNVTGLLETTNLLAKRFNIDAHLILSKYDDNNVAAVREIIAKYNDINFKVIPDVFPYTTNQCIARKYFNAYKYDDILFLDTFALYKIYMALKEGLPVADRYITICFGEATKVYVVKTKYGANLGELIKNSLSESIENKDIYLNNFMRRVKCDNLESLVVSDNTKTIFIFDKQDIKASKCIKCGKCVDICPVEINPLAKVLDSACIRCGLCSYVCPANINLLSKEK